MFDPVAILKEDHRKVETLIARWKASLDEDFARSMCSELRIHMVIEDEAVYPFLDGETQARPAVEDHDQIRMLITQVEDSATVDIATMKQLEAGIKEHIKKEEEDWFPFISSTVGKHELHTMGAHIWHSRAVAASAQAEKEGGRSLTPKEEGSIEKEALKGIRSDEGPTEGVTEK